MLDTATNEITGVMTRKLRAALKRADSFCLDFDDKTATIRLLKRTKPDDPFGDGLWRSALFPGFAARVGRGHRDDTCTKDGDVWYSDRHENDYWPTSGCWVISYAQYHHELMSAFASVPIGSELSFTVALDAHSNGYCARARLHADVLRMTAKKGKTLRTFMLDATVCAHNTARFGFRL